VVVVRGICQPLATGRSPLCDVCVNYVSQGMLVP